MKILVTGSSGNAGKAITVLLQSQGHEVIGLDRLPGPKTMIIGEINDEKILNKFVPGIDVIIHTASLHAPHVTQFSREEFVRVNIQGTLRLLEVGKKYGLKKFIYTSTTSVYGKALESSEEAVWVTEAVYPQPRDIYDITKLAAEQLCKDFYDKEQVETICLRVSRFWDEPLPDRVFYRMYRALDVRDVARAHLLAMNSANLGFEVFNISSQSPFSEEDLAVLKHQPEQVIRKKVPALMDYFAYMGWEMPKEIDRVYVIAKAKALLGYSPSYNIQEMLAKLH